MVENGLLKIQRSHVCLEASINCRKICFSRIGRSTA